MVMTGASTTGPAEQATGVRLTRQQLLLIAFCTLVSLIDGFDSQAIAFAGPSLVRDFGLSPSELGSVFSAGLFGGICGALPVGHVERHIGRRTLLFVCALWFAGGAFGTVFASSGAQLMVIRFLSGIGLGMALPLVMGSIGDSIPHAVRARALALVTCALPGGGAIAGVVATLVIPRFGWEALFYVAGSLPMLIVPLLGAAVSPERIVDVTADQEGSARSPAGRVLFHALFAQGGTRLLILLPVCFFSSAVAYALLTWTPTLLLGMGVDRQSAAIAGGVLNGGAMMAFLVMGYLLDRRGPIRVTASFYALAAASLVALATTAGSRTWVLAFALLSGFAGVGVQIAMTYMFMSIVSPQLRVAAVSLGMVSSRTGGAAGPLAVGLLAQAGYSPSTIFLCIAAVPLLAAFGTVALGSVSPSDRLNPAAADPKHP